MKSLTSRNDLRVISSQLSDRDWRVLRFIRQHQFVNTIQVRRMFFRDHASVSAGARACARVLDRLYQRRVLSRLERRVGGVKHGSSSYIWCLDVVGDRLSRQPKETRWRPHEPSRLFLDHTLAISETHVQLIEAEAEQKIRLGDVAIETEAWKQFVSSSGAKSILKPDLRITIGGEGYDDYWYLEIDRGTESLPVLMRKCYAYDNYRRTGRGQAEHGVFPRVLWILPSSGRVERLRAAIAAEPDLPAGLFTCIHTDQLIPTLVEPP